MMNPGKSKDNFTLSTTSDGEGEGVKSLETENQQLKNNAKHTKPAARRAMMEQKQELMTKCLDVLKKPDDKEEKPCHFSLFIAGKLNQMDRMTRAMAEKRICDVIFDLEMNGPHLSSENERQNILYNGNFNMPISNGP